MAGGPFLDIVTRTIPGRERLLARNMASLRALRDPDWSQRIIMDADRRGVAWAVGNLATVPAAGAWVWILDDDDLCTDPDLIGVLKAAAAAADPDVIMVRVDHGDHGLMPPAPRWRRQPARGWCSCPNVITRADVWDQYRAGWSESYSGDFDYMAGLWAAGLRWAWLDRVVARQPAALNGATESEAGLAL